MNAYQEAAAAAAIDYSKIVSKRKQKTLKENINKFLATSPRPGPYPSQVIASLHEIGRSDIGDRIDIFSMVRGYFADNPPDKIDTPFEEFELPLFEQIAYFEAVALEYHDSGALQIDDKIFNRSLSLLVALNETTISSESLNLITEYYKGMDNLLALSFHQSHNRRESWIRLGPFSVSCQTLHKNIDRPSIILNSEQKVEFVTRSVQVLNLGFPVPIDRRVKLFSERIGNSPVAVSFRG